MLPLKDDNPTRRFPILTVGLILLNLAVFLYQSQKPDDASLTGQTAFICEYGVVPDRVIDGEIDATSGQFTTCGQANEEQPRGLALITSQFLHGGWLHLLGNMLFLWIFGNNIEDRLGRIRFLPFYLLCGAIAALGQALTDRSSDIPLIGASGAIAGITGAYILLYPRARIWTIALFIPIRLPAWIVLGAWIAFQFLYVGGEAQDGEGGVAYWAHIAGFLAGLALITPFLAGRGSPSSPRPQVPRV